MSTEYEYVRILGRGAYAVVWLVRGPRGLEVLKRYHAPMSELSVKQRQEVAQEIKLLAHLRHPNIIAFRDNFVEEGVMHIVMVRPPPAPRARRRRQCWKREI
jgi:serine/threonine protein kinase